MSMAERRILSAGKLGAKVIEPVWSSAVVDARLEMIEDRILRLDAAERAIGGQIRGLWVLSTLIVLVIVLLLALCIGASP